jgi:hypothetical protein
MSSLERNARDSPLLRLPAELRNRVYELVLYEGRYNFAGNKYVDFDTGWESLDGVKVYAEDHNRLSLLRVCRQLYCDTALLPFSLNTFVFRSRSIRELAKESLSPLQAGAIESVHLYLETSVHTATPLTGLVFSKSGRLYEDLPVSMADSYLPLRLLPGLRNIAVSIEKHGFTGYRDYTDADVARWIDTLSCCLHDGNERKVVVVVDEQGEDLSGPSSSV